MIETSKKKPPKQKWNRAHRFQRKKSTARKVGHPVLVYGKRGRFSKYLVFTHTPEVGNEANYEKLRHNIDPLEDGKRDTWVKKIPEVVHSTSLREPDRKYRIHEDDIKTIKKYKK